MCVLLGSRGLVVNVRPCVVSRYISFDKTTIDRYIQYMDGRRGQNRAPQPVAMQGLVSVRGVCRIRVADTREPSQGHNNNNNNNKNNNYRVSKSL